TGGHGRFSSGWGGAGSGDSGTPGRSTTASESEGAGAGGVSVALSGGEVCSSSADMARSLNNRTEERVTNSGAQGPDSHAKDRGRSGQGAVTAPRPRHPRDGPQSARRVTSSR